VRTRVTEAIFGVDISTGEPPGPTLVFFNGCRNSPPPCKNTRRAFHTLVRSFPGIHWTESSRCRVCGRAVILLFTHKMNPSAHAHAHHRHSLSGGGSVTRQRVRSGWLLLGELMCLLVHQAESGEQSPGERSPKLFKVPHGL